MDFIEEGLMKWTRFRGSIGTLVELFILCYVLGWKRDLRSLLTGAGKRRAERLFSQSGREKRWWVERRVAVGDGREGSCGGVEFLGVGEDAVGTTWMCQSLMILTALKRVVDFLCF